MAKAPVVVWLHEPDILPKPLAVRENIDLGPTDKIQFSAMRQEVETGLRNGRTFLAGQIDIKLGFELVQIEHVGRGIGALGLGQIGRAPIGRLLLLGEFDADEFAGQIFEPVPIRIGAGEFRGDLGAIDGRREHTKAVHEHGDVETAKMEQFEDSRIGQKALQIGCAGLIGCDLNEIRAAIAARELDKAKAIPMRVKPQGFGIDRNDGAEIVVIRQIAAMKPDGHGVMGSLTIKIDLNGDQSAIALFRRMLCFGVTAFALTCRLAYWRKPAEARQCEGWCPGEDSNLHLLRD